MLIYLAVSLVNLGPFLDLILYILYPKIKIIELDYEFDKNKILQLM